MAKAVSGVSVLVKIDSTGGSNPVVIGGQTGASINMTQDTIDVTCKDSVNDVGTGAGTDGWRSFLSSWKQWTTDLDAFVCLEDSGQESLYDAFNDGVAVTVEIQVGEDSTAGTYTYEGKAYITDISEDYGQDDGVTMSVSLQGSGKLDKTYYVAP